MPARLEKSGKLRKTFVSASGDVWAGLAKLKLALAASNSHRQVARHRFMTWTPACKGAANKQPARSFQVPRRF
jgi:hypothetical protein